MKAIIEENELSYESFRETFASINKPETSQQGPISCRDDLNKVPSFHANGTTAESPKRTVETKRIEFDQEDLRSMADYGASEAFSSAPDLSKASAEGSTPTRRRKLRKVSITKLGEAVHSAVTSRRKSTSRADIRSSDIFGSPSSSSSLGFSERRFSNWMSNSLAKRLAPSEGESASTDGDGESSGSISVKSSSSSSAGGKPAVFRIPATRLETAAHRGYLDCSKKKKKNWERFWCVLQDSCLYCYNTPQSDVTRDAVLLRGYDVIANVTDLNRTRFVFRLQQKGVPTLHFASDNHRDFLLWVGTIEKETRRVISPPITSEPETLEIPLKNAPIRRHRASMPSLSAPYNPLPNQKQSAEHAVSQDKLDRELAEMQKRKLLREMSLQRKLIAEEQRLLDKVTTTDSSSSAPSLHHSSKDSMRSPPTRRVSRDEVNDHYERARDEEELKVAKFLTFLNRRRNSAQLKVDQFSKDLAPKSGRRRRDNHFHFSAMEARLREMQEALAKIDREFAEEEANKLHNLEKLQQKRDLELVILEQRETIDIMRRHQAKGGSHRRRHTLGDVLSPLSGRSLHTLGSIDELSSISDDRASSSTSNSSVSETNGVLEYSPTNNSRHVTPLSVSTPLTSNKRNKKKSDLPASSVLQPHPGTDPRGGKRLLSNDGNMSSDADSGFQQSRSLEDLDSYSGGLPGIVICEPAPVRSAPDGKDDFASVVDGRRSTTSTSSERAAQEDISADILAKIEDFEAFARCKLGKA